METEDMIQLKEHLPCICKFCQRNGCVCRQSIGYIECILERRRIPSSVLIERRIKCRDCFNATPVDNGQLECEVTGFRHQLSFTRDCFFFNKEYIDPENNGIWIQTIW
jgi:hypothetical protein